MHRLFLDFETHYSDDYSLTKMTPVEYVLHPQYETLGCSFMWNDSPKFWVDGPDLPHFFSLVPWRDTMAVSHNGLFDMLILSMKYGHVPAFYGDTMAMAQNWIFHSTGKVRLSVCAEYYGLPKKGDALIKTKGLNFHALQQDLALKKEFVDYAIRDVEICQLLYDRMLAEGFPDGQLDIIDMVIRMATEPKFVFDQELLAVHLDEVVRQKQELLEKCELTSGDNLRSNAAFVWMLQMADPNLEIPTKISKRTGKLAFATAKTDKAFTDLLNHDNPEVQALVAARLGHNSTIEETRTRKFLDISRVAERMPIPLRYSGAHTHRFSGDWKLNMQNLPNGSNLRYALRAPPGMKVVSIDASQIEARINAVLSEQWDLVEDFRAGIDVYAQFAKLIYGYDIHKDRQKTERFVGKTAVLSLGYGSSAPTFQNMVRNKGGVTITDHEASKIVSLYRTRYDKIAALWAYADRVVIPQIAANGIEDREWGPIHIGEKSLVLPNHNLLRYRDLKHTYNEDFGKHEWRYLRGDRPYTLYGAKLVENVVQALAFVHIMEVALKVSELTNGELMPAHQVHDELIYVERDEIAELVGTLVKQEMSKPPKWMPDLPLAAEVNIGQSYGDTK